MNRTSSATPGESSAARESAERSRAAARGAARGGRCRAGQAPVEAAARAAARPPSSSSTSIPTLARLAVAPQLEGGGPAAAAAARARLRSPAPRQRARAEEDQRDVQVLRRHDTRPPCRCSAARRRSPRPSRRGAARAQKRRTRSSPPTLAADRVTCLSRLGDKSAHEVQRRDRGAAADRLAVAGKLKRRSRSPIGPDACRKTSPTGFSSLPPPGPGDARHRDGDVGVQPLACAARHRGGDLGRDRAVRAAAAPGRRAAPA